MITRYLSIKKASISAPLF